MQIQTVPESYLPAASKLPDLMLHDFRMTEEVIRSKVQLSMHMFSFLQTGRKLVHIADSCIGVNPEQSLLIRNGNALWSELPDHEDVYYCKLLFFSDAMLRDFLDRHADPVKATQESLPFFVIGNDAYLQGYIQTLSTIMAHNPNAQTELLQIKFNEILLYLRGKYGPPFMSFLHSLLQSNASGFREIVENHVQPALKVKEIAFLCNMSLSTFKRHFLETYGQAPGVWYKNQRLGLAHKILAQGLKKPSDIYLDFGYSNLSNFSVAFKQQFGFSPRQAGKDV